MYIYRSKLVSRIYFPSRLFEISYVFLVQNRIALTRFIGIISIGLGIGTGTGLSLSLVSVLYRTRFA